jgi:hemoglobin
MAAESLSLYQRLGGAAAVEAAVDVFYGKVLADPLLQRFFAGTDMQRQRQMQKAFLTLAFGGPNRYSGRGMREAHARPVAAGLGDREFDAVVGHLASTLTGLGVAPAQIAEVAAIAESVRKDVLGR